MSDMNQTRALYEIKRQGLLLGFAQTPSAVSSALAYAYDNRMFPYFHDGLMLEVHECDPFEGCYSVSNEFIASVLKNLTSLWDDQNYEDMAFYKFENRFGGHHSKRVELIHTFTYTRLSDRFDDKVFSAIEANAPIEASSISNSFSPSEISLGY